MILSSLTELGLGGPLNSYFEGVTVSDVFMQVCSGLHCNYRYAILCSYDMLCFLNDDDLHCHFATEQVLLKVCYIFRLSTTSS